MGQHSDEEDEALRIWREAGDTPPAKIRALGEIFGLGIDAADEDADDADRMLNAAFHDIFEAAAVEYERPADNFERATSLAPAFSASVSPTAAAVWKAVKDMGEYMEAEEAKELERDAERLAREQQKASE